MDSFQREAISNKSVYFLLPNKQFLADFFQIPETDENVLLKIKNVLIHEAYTEVKLDNVLHNKLLYWGLLFLVSLLSEVTN